MCFRFGAIFGDRHHHATKGDLLLSDPFGAIADNEITHKNLEHIYLPKGIKMNTMSHPFNIQPKDETVEGLLNNIWKDN